MTLLKPNQLRYAYCELPADLTGVVNAFVDEFYNNMSAISLNLDEYNANVVPGIMAALQEQVSYREQLVEGSRIIPLSTLQNIQDSLSLDNPQLLENDPVLVRLDERKMGAAGMVLLNGVMYALTTGRDIDCFRQIWFAAGGVYEAFLALGDGIEGANDGEFTLLQFVQGSGKMPFINRTWDELNGLQPYIKLSKYNQPLIWTNKIDTTGSTYNKLRAIGYSDAQCTLALTGQQPGASSTVLSAYLSSSTAYLQSYAALLLLPLTNPLRQPPWQNEVKNFSNAATAYLNYRTQKNLGSYVFNSTVWEQVKAVLSAADMKELFENRPEVLNMQVPTDQNTIGDLINSASKTQINSTVINSYMIRLPKPNSTTAYEQSLISSGQRLYDMLQPIGNASASTVLSQIEEIKGAPVSDADIITSVTPLTLNQMNTLLSSSSSTPSATVNSISRAVVAAPNPGAAQDALQGVATGSTANPAAANPTQGLPTVENFMSILLRRVDWANNFTTCSKSTAIKSGNTLAQNNDGISTDKFTKFGPSFNSSIQQGPGASTNPSQIYGGSGNPLLSQPQNYSRRPSENTDLKTSPVASERTNVVNNQNASATTVNQEYSYNCTISFSNGVTQYLASEGEKLLQTLIEAIEALKLALTLVQNIIDQLIAKVQVVLDQVLGTLQRLLSLDLNLAGSMGVDTGMIKCSWSLDLGLKIDLFGLLLKAINDFLNKYLGPIRQGLAFLKDLLTQAICVPVRIIEAFLGGVNSLLNLVGCSLAPVLLPKELLDLLKSLLFTFDLRSLVLQKGYDAVFQATANFTKNKNTFAGLTQFATLCQSVTMAQAMDTIQGTLLQTVVQAPTAASSAISAAASTAQTAATSALLGV